MTFLIYKELTVTKCKLLNFASYSSSSPSPFWSLSPFSFLWSFSLSLKIPLFSLFLFILLSLERRHLDTTLSLSLFALFVVFPSSDPLLNFFIHVLSVHYFSDLESWFLLLFIFTCLLLLLFIWFPFYSWLKCCSSSFVVSISSTSNYLYVSSCVPTTSSFSLIEMTNTFY